MTQDRGFALLALLIAIASASKWVSAVAILTLVDDGLIDLDAPLSTYLPQFTGSKGTMTVRQMFSHTSGLPGGSSWAVLTDGTITLAEAADEKGARELVEQARAILEGVA